MTTKEKYGRKKEIHPGSDQETRSASESPSRKGRRKYIKIQTQKSRAFEKPADEEKSKSCGNIRQAKEEKIKPTVRINYKPLQEQLLTLADYAGVLTLITKSDKSKHICMLLDLIESVKRQCEQYYNYELMKEGLHYTKYGNQKF